MLIQILYSAFRGLISLIAPDAVIKGLLAENMMLRQRMIVQTRNKPCPRLRIRDRLFFAALSRHVPKERWASLGSRRRPYCAGTVRLWPVNGPSGTKGLVAHRPTRCSWRS